MTPRFSVSNLPPGEGDFTQVYLTFKAIIYYLVLRKFLNFSRLNF